MLCRVLRHRLALGALLIAMLLTSSLAATAPSAGARGSGAQDRFVLNGVVTSVVDGDTMVARLNSGRVERVRLIGIDTPERGTCYFEEASARARSLALGRRAALHGDPTQARRDRYGRLLAYVHVRGSVDVGRALIRSGHAEVYVHDRPFQRVASYRTAENDAKTATAGRWRACKASVSAPPALPGPPPAPPATQACHPSYPTVCIPPPPPDLDCGDIPHRNFPVVGADPHRFDGNHDGRGCES
jgi:micrococcal nuclease